MRKKYFYGAGDSIRPTGARCWRRMLSLELSDILGAGFGYECGRSNNRFFFRYCHDRNYFRNYVVFARYKSNFPHAAHCVDANIKIK